MAPSPRPRIPSDLSLVAKVGQVNQRLKGWEAVRWVDGRPRVTDLLRAEVDRFGGIGALYGVLRADPWSAVRWETGIPPERSAEAYAAVQDVVLTRGEGVPALFVEEAPHGLMALGGTTLPVNLALGASMDAPLAEELGAAVAAEARERGTHLLLVSGLDVLRDGRWGRAEECFSEDPAIAAMLVEATVRGMQGAAPGAPIDADHVAVVAKHLAGQGAGIGGRNGSGAPVGPREIGEIHLRPAFAAARAGVAGFMSAYNDLDGVPCTGNRALLTGTLREQWGWDGIIMSDGGAIDLLTRATGTLHRAAALALSAGVDLSLWDRSYTLLADVVSEGLVPESVLDQAVSRVLALKARLGLLGETGDQEPATAADGPVDAAGAPGTSGRSHWLSARSRESIRLAHEAARRSVVVLTGHPRLPLRTGRVAVVGPNADALHAQLGDYVAPRPPEDPAAATVRTALRDRLGTLTDRPEEAEAVVAVLGGTSRRTYEDEFAHNGAAHGPSQATGGEGVDLAALSLPEAQLAVVRAAKETGAPVIAVVIDGRPRVLTALLELADAVVVAPYGGPSSGRAIAEVLCGPSAGAAETVPQRGLLPATLPAADGVHAISHDERLEIARYADQPEVRGPLLGAGLQDGVEMRVPEVPAALTAAALAAGTTAQVTVEVLNRSGGPVEAPIVLFGRRHESGIVPRTRTVLAARRAVIPVGPSLLGLELGLDALGSWAGGAPRPVPVEVELWAGGGLEPPPDAPRLRVLP